MAKAKTAEKTRAEVELRPDGWERFRLAVSAAAKSGPKHLTTKKSARKRKPLRTTLAR